MEQLLLVCLVLSKLVKSSHSIDKYITVCISYCMSIFNPIIIWLFLILSKSCTYVSDFGLDFFRFHLKMSHLGCLFSVFYTTVSISQWTKSQCHLSQKYFNASVCLKVSASVQAPCHTLWVTTFWKLTLKPGICTMTSTGRSRKEWSPSPLIQTGRNPGIPTSRRTLTLPDA